MGRYLVFLALPLLCSCFHTKLNNPNATPGEKKEYQTSHYMGGFGTAVVDVECQNGIYEVSQGRTFGNAFMSGLTIGIWNPQTIRVTCAQ